MTVFRNSQTAFARASVHLENIKFSHSIFALPFAIAGALLAVRDRNPSRWLPEVNILLLIIAAVVAARTCAMAVNRIVDARIDAKNPRTAARAIPAGMLTIGGVTFLAAASGAIFVIIAFLLSPLCGWLSPVVLAVLLGYSWTKRFTELAHVVLGLSLGLAPGGAWLGVQGDFKGNIWIPILLGMSVLFWVAGFDLIYACQDAEHDRKQGLHSIPGRFGVSAALSLSTIFHICAVGLFVMTGRAANLSATYYVFVGLIAALLAWEHAIVRPNDLSRVNAAFFTLNGWVSVLFLFGLILDIWF
ncbi:MAG: UbiA-like polyprenyltransferase [Planctomycetota bacterium]